MRAGANNYEDASHPTLVVPFLNTARRSSPSLYRFLTCILSCRTHVDNLSNKDYNTVTRKSS
jgi:hypothetical protein